MRFFKGIAIGTTYIHHVENFSTCCVITTKSPFFANKLFFCIAAYVVCCASLLACLLSWKRSSKKMEHLLHFVSSIVVVRWTGCSFRRPSKRVVSWDGPLAGRRWQVAVSRHAGDSSFNLMLFAPHFLFDASCKALLLVAAAVEVVIKKGDQKRVLQYSQRMITRPNSTG